MVPSAFLPILPFLFLTTTEGMMEPEQEVVNVSAILNQFMVGYDKRVRPNYGGIPVTVGVSLYILSIGDLSEKFMDFTFDMYFRQFWHDPRLAFEKRPSLTKLVVGAEYIKLIWVPDTFFVNEKVALFHQATTENQFLRIMWSGDVLRSIRLTIKATCPLDLQVENGEKLSNQVKMVENSQTSWKSQDKHQKIAPRTPVLWIRR